MISFNDFSSIILKNLINRSKESFLLNSSNKNMFSLWINSTKHFETFHELSKKSRIIIYNTFTDYYKNEEVSEKLVIDAFYEINSELYPNLEGYFNKLLLNSITLFDELISKLHEKRNLIQSHFDISNFEISSFKFGLGDPHCNGRTVALISFESGQKLVYKPRSLNSDLLFSKVLDLFNLNVKHHVEHPKVLSFSDFGLVEFIEYLPLEQKEDARKYYYRIGIYVFILYCMEAVDFHYENVIASGEHPVLIDLEALMLPLYPIHGLESNQNNNTSVLENGLLPNQISLGDESFDISGLTDPSMYSSPFETEHIVEINGKPDISRSFDKLQSSNNIPFIGKTKIPISIEYLVDVQAGFQDAYECALENLLELKELFNSFADVKVRVLFRPTYTYSHILSYFSHPEFLASGNQNLDRYINNALSKVSTDLKLVNTIIPFEYNQLKNLDVPYFYTYANSRDLLTCNEMKVESGFFWETGVDRVFNKLDSLCKEDMIQQKWIIESSIKLNQKSSVKSFVKEIRPISFEKFDNLSRSKKKDIVLDFVKNVREEIITKTGVQSGLKRWSVINAKSLDSNIYSIDISSYDFASGMPGEILFLCQYGYVYNCRESKKMAKTIYQNLFEFVFINHSNIKPLGLVAGIGSLIHLNNLLFQITKHDLYLNNTKKLISTFNNFETLYQLDNSKSLVKGSAGLIIALMQYYRWSEDKKSLEISVKIGEYLSDSVEIIEDRAMGFKIFSDQPLTGLSHGCSGFIIAYAQIYFATKNKKYLDIISGLLKYEDKYFSKMDENWEDLRDFVLKTSQQSQYSNSWAHGAPGIGISRMFLISNDIKLENVCNDLKTAVKKAKSRSFGLDSGVINGDLGVLDFLIEYSEKFNSNENFDFSLNVMVNLIERYKKDKLVLNQHGIKTLGYMSGITGMAHICLRLLDRDNCPSALTFS
jgi:type 2 lantibiotic biosynthesis protein LanM